MTYPSFLAGDILTATDMNAVGLWKIFPSNVVNGTVSDGVVTIGANVATCRVEGVFSSNYNNYLVLMSGVKAQTGTNTLRLQLGTAGGNNFYGSTYYDSYLGTSGTIRFNNAAQIEIGYGEATLGEQWTRLEIAAPNLARSTAMSGQYYGNTYSGWFAGTRADSVQYTNFTINAAGNNMNGGTIRVYGYRN